MIDTNDKLEIHQLTQRLEEIEREREELIKRIKSLPSYEYPSETNISGRFFLKLIEEHLEKHPKSSKLQVAQQLSISQGRLYDLINGKRMISTEIQARIAEKLGLNEEQKITLQRKCLEDREQKKEARKKISQISRTKNPQ